jgi:RNA-directed DNA polymerase
VLEYQRAGTASAGQYGLSASAKLNAIYETDFLGFSYGFRPGRSQHQALDALYTGLLTRKVNWVLDLDIKGFFDGLSHEWLVKFIEHRIACSNAS